MCVCLFLYLVLQVVVFNADINSKIPVCADKMRLNERLSKHLWKQFEHVCRLVDYNIPIVFEWPRHNLLWKIPRVTTLLKKLGCSMTQFDGCQYGLKSARKGM